jgi:hypothetical protein
LRKYIYKETGCEREDVGKQVKELVCDIASH